MSRWLKFLTAMAIGVAGGLYYGWVINPTDPINTTPETLRADYKADYVLMVAEAYQADGDLSVATQRLALLDDLPSEQIVVESIHYAREAGTYLEPDLLLMEDLTEALRSINSSPVSPTP